jgi:hypothetical protein
LGKHLFGDHNGTGNKNKWGQWNYIKLKSFYTAKEKNHENKETTYRIGENTCKLYI